jgi:hypothetical protein
MEGKGERRGSCRVILAGKFNRLASPVSIFLNLQRLKMTCGARGTIPSKSLGQLQKCYYLYYLMSQTVFNHDFLYKKVNIITIFHDR